MAKVGDFNSGDRVYHDFTKGSNAKKVGEYIGMARYRPGGLYGPLYYHSYLALVWWDGNSSWSKVPIWRLKPEAAKNGA